jgi:peptide/nickel transport system substrate-binding protein
MKGDTMKRRSFVAGTAALAGLAAGPWRMALAENSKGEPKYGGTLTVAYASDIHSGRFTLNRSGPPGYETYWVSNNIHNQLVTLGPDYEIAPDLAKSWEVIDKGKEYIFHLHENVKFHDGTDCDAEAVKWNFDDMMEKGPKSWVYIYFNLLDSTEVVDKHTFKVIMKEPAALLPALAGYFGGVPIGSPTAVEKYGDDWNRHPVGSGPFTYDINDYQPDRLIVLKKNPNYFKKDQHGNALPYLDRIEIQVIKDPLAAMTALRTEQIDFLQRISAQHVPIMERAEGVVLETAPERMPLVCFMNMRKPPFDDVRVRKAIGGYGLNRKEIAQTVFQGRATPLVSILPPGVQDYLDLNEMYPYDPEKAKALLKEAGYDENNPVEFELILNNDAPFFADAATLMKSQYEKIGVKMKLTMMDKPAWLDRFLRKYDYQMGMEDFGALVDINQRSVSFFRGVKSNYGGLNSPEIEELTMKWRREVDPDKRREIAYDIQRAFAKDMLWCNVTGSPYYQAYRDYVKGYHFMNQLYVHWETTWLDKA